MEGADTIDGKGIAATIRGEIRDEVKALVEAGGPQPCLAVVLVGSRKDSQTYVRMKTRACAEAGIRSLQREIAADVTQEALEAEVRALSADPSVNGILVQLPLPDGLDADAVVAAVDPRKDVDGLTAANMGELMVRGPAAALAPCTPLGCVELLDRTGVRIEGARAVVIGRSQLVGKPVAMLLLGRNATVTVCHSRTADLPSVVREADIVVAAVGRPGFVQASWIKPGAAVIDVGINAVDDATKKAGYRLVGDVDTAAARAVAGSITPVPGGVGPMTVAMLLRNTLAAYKAQRRENVQQ